ncbi:hypothetical protein L1049_015461 [Liquidambar formosana]|uniref:BURP domain-containing protein n=1 Tax=Liquidambar formosana TaxID=63359 RepID=A0AAP0RY46_LIQFO
MLDLIRGIFSLETHFEVLTTTHLRKSPTLQYNYTILEVPKEVFAPKIVACHPMPYPYAVSYCHSQESGNKVFKTSLGGENGDEVEAFAVCHMDTSGWNPDHISFRLLGVKPGSSPKVVSIMKGLIALGKREERGDRRERIEEKKREGKIEKEERVKTLTGARNVCFLLTAEDGDCRGRRPACENPNRRRERG